MQLFDYRKQITTTPIIMMPGLLLTLLFMCSLNAEAQAFSMPWIYCPYSDSTSQTFFKNTYTLKDTPQNAQLTVGTTGLVSVYVNGMNVSTNAIEPMREDVHDNMPTTLTYDITGFLHSQSNTIAIWYSPTMPRIDSMQVAAKLYGQYKNGNPFEDSENNRWLCHNANYKLTQDGGESIEGDTYFSSWKDQDWESAIWSPVKEMGYMNISGKRTKSSNYTSSKIVKIIQPDSLIKERSSWVCSFCNTFNGWIRITFRGCIKGEKINIGGLEYTCNGTMDEQACRRFTTSDCRNIIIYGDSHFKPSQIQSIEGLIIEPVRKTSDWFF